MTVIPQQDLDRMHIQHQTFMKEFINILSAHSEAYVQEVETDVHLNPRGIKHRTGNLGRSFDNKVFRSRKGNLLRVQNKAFYAKILEEGAKPFHNGTRIIRAKNARFLRFKDKSGRIIYRKSVRHPGIKPTHFLFRAVISSYTNFNLRLTRDLTALAARFSRRRF